MTKPEVHAIYSKIPTLAGALIEQPDGSLAYGARDAAAPAAAMPAYSHTPPPYPYMSTPYAVGAPQYSQGMPAYGYYSAGVQQQGQGLPLMANQAPPPGYARGPAQYSNPYAGNNV